MRSASDTLTSLFCIIVALLALGAAVTQFLAANLQNALLALVVVMLAVVGQLVLNTKWAQDDRSP